MSNINRAVRSQKENKAAPQFFESCDCVTAVEPSNVKVYSDGTYYIEIDEEITPSRYAHDIKYYVDED
ncbi:hypothetical protein [Cyanobacterium aponinum]|uniref:hypothetical protein n=1 Tax=Cyanobacterium aponinum TaxID=379064 RepID=UPI000C12A0C2|nr:hypothetical protein [Cyanobacterium aponinum]PHV61006.1 hypothetical protein CSQ80_17925 [Cyanobacterium aponinum IPPAS B-1201]